MRDMYKNSVVILLLNKWMRIYQTWIYQYRLDYYKKPIDARQTYTWKIVPGRIGQQTTQYAKNTEQKQNTSEGTQSMEIAKRCAGRTEYLASFKLSPHPWHIHHTETAAEKSMIFDTWRTHASNFLWTLTQQRPTRCRGTIVCASPIYPHYSRHRRYSRSRAARHTRAIGVTPTACKRMTFDEIFSSISQLEQVGVTQRILFVFV